jgi:hypothetical protein
VRRLAVTAAVVVAVVGGSALAATKTYSTGNINDPIGQFYERSLTVPDRGPVSFVRVSFRLTTPDTSALAISLVSPQGTEIPLVVKTGAGADFGSGRGCGGFLTVLDSDETTNSISADGPPFTDGPYRAAGNLASLYGEDARGRWTLRIAKTDAVPAHLNCFTLDISRDVPQTLKASQGKIAATLTFTERNFLFDKLRVKVVRAGRTVLDSPIQRVACPDCAGDQPVKVSVRDLDGGDPEVLFDLYSGGAHCCMFTLILRWDAAATRYRAKLAYWGNYGSRLADLDGDGLPEFSAFDERFVYEYSAYVFSSAPIQIWSYRQGRLVDVTRDYPALIRKSAATNLGYYDKGCRQKDVDVRSYVAAYVADQYLLGDATEGQRLLELALKRGDLGDKSLLGLPGGTRFVSALMRDLRRWGYIKSP